VVVGLLFAAEFLFVAEGLRRTTASPMSVFLYTAPTFAAMGLHLRLPEDRLSRMQWCGIGLAFSGIVVTFVGPSTVSSRASLLGDMMGPCAGASWGLRTVAVRTSRLGEAPATQTLFYQLSAAFLVLLPLAAITGSLQFHGTPLVWGSFIFRAVIISFASYLAWFEMLRRYQAAGSACCRS
jgi:drug/metabolite transporter (DMT)-like permease